MTIKEELVSIADRLIALADSLPNEESATKSETETKNAEVTLDELRAFLAKKARVSKENQESIKGILKNHGAESLSKLNPLDYEAVMEEVRTLDG